MREVNGQSLVNLSFLLYVVTSATDRFVVKISDPFYIVIMLLAIALMVTGIFKRNIGSSKSC
ncbi:MAG TPA: hypothetical protein GX522_07010 [Firmicutes bacterium]|jgi:hypothetical protein|nr:hypothetical protein [Bacillota bacterium]